MIDSVHGSGGPGSSGRINPSRGPGSSPASSGPAPASGAEQADRVEAPESSRARSLARAAGSSDPGREARMAAAKEHLASGYFQSDAGMKAIAEGLSKGS